MNLKAVFISLLFLCVGHLLFAQVTVIDSAGNTKPLTAVDSAVVTPKPKFDTSFSPRKATIRSAIIPGWGQIYNKQIWKVPLVYAAVGISAGVFFYNIKDYRGLRDAYKYTVDTISANNDLIADRYKGLSANSLKFYRDEVRKNVDRSVLVFLLAWALNVVDATVAAQLKQFDVGDDLSLKIKPTIHFNGQTGVSLVFSLK